MEKVTLRIAILFLTFLHRIFSILGPFDLYGTSARDPLLRGRRELIVQICRLIDYPENLEVSVAALHALTDINESPVFAATHAHAPHKLYSILEAAGELPNIMESFIRRLEREETEHVSLISDRGLREYGVAQGEEEAEDRETQELLNAFGLANLVRLQILDFFISSLRKPGYNLAHYLLGFKLDLLKGPAPSTAIVPPDKEGTNYNCLHIVLELLAYGLGHPSTPIVALDHPSLGRKCYELLVVLLSNRLTAMAVTCYLRDHEEFFHRQIAHFSPSPVDLSDPGYTIYEFFQKAALFTGAALDLQQSFAEGSWTYARKQVSLLVKGPSRRDPKEESFGKDQGALSTFLLQHLSSIDDVLLEQFLGELSPIAHESLLQAVASFVVACSKLCQLVLVGLGHLPYDRQIMVELQCQLVASLVPFLCKLQVNPHTSTQILEACSSLCVVIAGYCQTCEPKVSSLVGDEPSQIAKCVLQAMLRPDASLFARGYWYAAFCECYDLLGKNDPAALSVIKTVVASEASRILNVAASDSVISASDADGWKTMATSFLRVLLAEFEDLALHELLFKMGFIRNLSISIRVDDRSMASVLESLERNQSAVANCLLLWRMRMSLLESIALAAGGGERLLESGLCDYIAGLKILQPETVVIGLGPDATRKKLHLLVLTPLLRFLAVATVSYNANLKAALRSVFNSRSDVFMALLRLSDGVSGSSKVPEGERWEAATLVASSLRELSNSPEISKIFAPSMIAFASSIPDCPQSSLKIIACRSVIQFFLSSLQVDGGQVLIDFGSDCKASSAPAIPMQVCLRLLEYASQPPGIQADASSFWSAVEQLLLFICDSLKRRHVPLDDREIRHLHTSLGPFLETLSKKCQASPSREFVMQCISFIKARLILSDDRK